jgi:hypothetical protein
MKHLALVASLLAALCCPSLAQFNGCQAGFCAPQPPSGGVTIALDGSGTTNSSLASFTIPLTTANGSGLIVVTVGSNNSTIPTSLVASGLTFTLRTTTANNGGVTNATFTAPYTSNFSGNITVNQGGVAAFTTATAFGISGVHTASPFDGSAVIGTTGTVAITTTHANTFIFAMYGSAVASPGAGAGWTAINSSNFFITEYQIVSTIQPGLTATTASGATLSGIIDAVVQGP